MATSTLPPSTPGDRPSIHSLSSYANTPPIRLQSLYSDIARQKHSNPTFYHASVEWWRRVLEEVVSSRMQGRLYPSDGSSKLVLMANRSLLDMFRVDGVGRPLGLAAVVNELRQAKALFQISEFLDAKESVYDAGWLPARIAAYVVGKPLWWALEQLGIVNEDGGESGPLPSFEEYVVLGLVERAADAIISRQANNARGQGDAVYSLEEFRKEFADVLGGKELCEKDVKILLRFLERDRKVLVVDKKQSAVKFVETNASAEAREINAVDLGILELRTAVRNMHVQIDGIQNKMDDSKEKAASALRQQRKPVALSYLAYRKQLEVLLSQRLGSLQTLQSTLIRVEAAAGDVEIMKLYESSTATLRTILAHPSLQREKVDETMEAMAEATADAQDIDSTIRLGAMVTDGSYDESELEAELKVLAEEAERNFKEERMEVLRSEQMKTPQLHPEVQGRQERIPVFAPT